MSCQLELNKCINDVKIKYKCGYDTKIIADGEVFFLFFYDGLEEHELMKTIKM